MTDQDSAYSGGNRKTIDINSLDENEWKRIAFEAQILDELIKKGRRSRKSVALAGTALGWSPAKVYRKMARYRSAGHALALINPIPSGGSGKLRIGADQEALVEKSLKAFLKKKKAPVSAFVDDVQQKCAALGIDAPSERTIRRRFENLPMRIRIAHVVGSGKAAQLFNLQKGSTPECTYPLERVQIDHTAADVWLVSEDGSLVLGRPTVSLVIDEFSRIVLAIHVTFAAPKVEELAEAMAIACLPKGDWLASIGADGIEWPWHGLMSEIFVDRGVDFTSSAFERGCRKWRITLNHRQQCHHGGIIERSIGTAMQQTRLLPGNTAMSKATLREDRIDPSKTAKLTLRQYRQQLVDFFGKVYPHRIHPALGMTPADKWNLGVHQFGDPRKVSDPRQFYLDFLKGVTRKIEKYGLRNAYLDYRDVALQPLLNAAKSVDVLVKIDPADVSRAFVEDPRDGSYIELANDLTAGLGITQAEWENALRVDFD